MGCLPREGKNALPQPPPPAHPFGNPNANPAERVRLLSKNAATLGYDAQALPGGSAADHSGIMQRVFTDLLQILPLLGNPDNDRVLAQRLSIIQSARAQLSSGNPELSVDPIIDTALRAASAALADLSHTDGLEEAKVAPLLDKLSAQINRLDLERDPDLHRVDVAVAVDLCSQVVDQFAATLSSRFAAEQPVAVPTTNPAQGPK